MRWWWKLHSSTQHFGVAAEHCGHDPGAVEELSGAGVGEELVQLHGDDQGGAGLAVAGQLVGVDVFEQGAERLPAEPVGAELFAGGGIAHAAVQVVAPW